MTIFVDDIGIAAVVVNPENGVVHDSRWCHLFSDSLDPGELHAFAQLIGLKRSWFQHDPDMPWGDHYDVTRRKRWQAVKAGAIQVSCREAVDVWMVKQRKAKTGEMGVAE